MEKHGEGGEGRIGRSRQEAIEVQVKKNCIWHHRVSSGDKSSEQRDRMEVCFTGVFVYMLGGHREV